MTQIFDPTAFLDQTTEQASEKRDPLPAADYNATIKEVTMKAWESKDKVDDNGMLKSGIRLDLTLTVDVPQDILDRLGIKQMTLTDGAMLDMNDTKTAIDYSKGKNSRLRQYREATGLNVAGQAFSPRALVGRMVRIRVTHEEYPAGSGNILERVGAISKAQ